MATLLENHFANPQIRVVRIRPDRTTRDLVDAIARTQLTEGRFRPIIVTADPEIRATQPYGYRFVRRAPSWSRYPPSRITHELIDFEVTTL